VGGGTDSFCSASAPDIDAHGDRPSATEYGGSDNDNWTTNSDHDEGSRTRRDNHAADRCSWNKSTDYANRASTRIAPCKM